MVNAGFVSKATVQPGQSDWVSGSSRMALLSYGMHDDKIWLSGLVVLCNWKQLHCICAPFSSPSAHLLHTRLMSNSYMCQNGTRETYSCSLNARFPSFRTATLWTVTRAHWFQHFFWTPIHSTGNASSLNIVHLRHFNMTAILMHNDRHNKDRYRMGHRMAVTMR